MKNPLTDPTARRQALLIASGASILVGLALGALTRTLVWRDGFMLLAALLAGSDVALRAYRSLRNRYVSIELLVTVASVGAIIIGEYWEAAAVTFLFIFGAYLEARTLSRTRRALQDLIDLAPATAVVVRDGRQVEVLAQEVLPGETVLVKPGARVPVDGPVLSGRSTVDESAITGEPMPEEKSEGARVYAGTINGTGLLEVRAEGVGADTTLARIIHRVEEAQDEKAPAQRFIERFSRWYTPAIILLSALSYLITRDLELALTLLVIGCPGALVISTPVSIVAGIGRAAKAGILIKGGEYLENAGKITALALDKTGTLTQGRPRLTDIVALRPEPVLAGVSEDGRALPDVPAGRWSDAQLEVLRWAAAVEAGSEHPLARAILAAAEDLPDGIPAATDFSAVPGKGVSARVDGRLTGVGTPEYMAELGVSLDTSLDATLEGLKNDGKTAALVCVDDELLGVLGVSDPIRPTSAAMVAELRRAGVKRVVMLTGDDRLTAEAIARQAGIDEVRANLLPEDKLSAIRELQSEGHVVAMVGDGINDAPALAAADVSIAMGAAGSGVAIETADVALMADDLMKIPEAVRVSRAVLNNIRQNVTVALVTVSVLLAGVLVSWVNMAGGMLVHEASVMLVILNAMRLLRLK